MEPDDLVQQLGGEQRLDAMRGLIGAVNASELRHVEISDSVLDAVVSGLDDPNAKIRWWCVQMLDHINDVRAIGAVATALNDPVPRVRRNAAHALGCLACKPDWDGTVDPSTIERLQDLSCFDENAKVRAQVAATLSCHLATGTRT